ncbi:MAG TPA: hypothetical protein VMU39_17765, partial [Solirubrobacteraceae bacterium]|nr:hypothetical protein [Solirubrobacteraceae bacterium]
MFAAVLVWGAPGALADTTVIGEQSLVPNMGSSDQLGQNIPVFQGDAGAGYVLSAPRAGTIASWSFLSGGVATGKHFELVVLAPTDQTGMGWRLIATSSPVAVTTQTSTDAVNGPFPVQIPIDVGQRIALMPVDDSYTPIETGTQGVDGIRYFSQPFAGGLGSSQQIAPGSSADNAQLVPIQATEVFSGSPLPPQNTQLPSVSGTARQFETLTGDPGLWQNGVTGFTYAWLRCTADGTACAPVPGSNSTAYTLTRTDVGFTIRFQVIASNDGGDSQPTVSAPTAVVQRGVITAKLTLSPNPTCTGVLTTFDGSQSVSPDGIKSYSFRVIDLWGALVEQVGAGSALVSRREDLAEDSVNLAALTLTLPDGQTNIYFGDHDAQWLIDNFAGPAVVSDKPTSQETFDWNRAAIHPPNPSTLARDPVGVVLVVTDFAGHTARTFAVLNFAQHVSYDSRATCPQRVRILQVPIALLAGLVSFGKGSGQMQTTAGCQTRVACVGTITVVAG